MNEMSAPQFAEQDLARDLHKVERCQSPNEIADLVHHRLLVRISSMEQREALKAAKMALSSFEGRSTLSEHLATSIISAVKAASSHMAPESLRALMLWMVGDEDTGPGYLTRLMAEIKDSKTVPSIQMLITELSPTLQQVESVDKRLFNEVLKSLPRPQRRIVQSVIMESRWASHDGLDELASERIATARKLIELFGRHHIRVLKLYGSAA